MRRLLYVICALALGALVLAGCGGGGSDSVIPTTSDMVGAWRSDNVGDDTLVTFFGDGTYVLISPDAVGNNSIDSGYARGFEAGSFTLNSTTGVLTPNITFDDDGVYGFSDCSSNITVTLDDDVLDFSGAEYPSSAEKVLVDSTKPIVGAWFTNTPPQRGARAIEGYNNLLVFLSDGTYYYAEYGDGETTVSGVEYGTYNWNSTTKIIAATANVDSNTDSGLNNLLSDATITITGNTLTLASDGAETTYTRLGN